MRLEDYYKRRKGANLRTKFFICFLSLFLLISAVWGFFWIPYFRISNIEAVGADSEPDVKGAILSYLASHNRFFLPNNHYALLSTGRISAVLKESGFGLASVAKAFPDTLIIKFDKSEPWLIYCLPAEALAKAGPPDCYYVNAKGILGERTPHFSESPLPQISLKNSNNVKIGDGVISGEGVAFLKNWLEALKTIDAPPAAIEFSGETELKIFLKEGWFIYLPKNSDPQKLFYDLKLLLDQKIKEARPKLEYIDLRFENKAFYKLR